MEAAWKAPAKALFGRSLRVALAHWIIEREGEHFFQLEAQDAMRAFGEAPSGVPKELANFVEQGMLTTFFDERRHYFTAAETPLWAAFAAAAIAVGLTANATDDPEPRVGRTKPTTTPSR
ncbi:MAG: hypothetical protein U0Q22_15605 [Acidimicrobiales bacterium]